MKSLLNKATDFLMFCMAEFYFALCYLTADWE